jgi:hypothetical protein
MTGARGEQFQDKMLAAGFINGELVLHRNDWKSHARNPTHEITRHSGLTPISSYLKLQL